MANEFYLSAKSHLHPLQVEKCDSNARLVVDEDYNGESRLERIKENMQENTNLWDHRL